MVVAGVEEPEKTGCIMVVFEVQVVDLCGNTSDGPIFVVRNPPLPFKVVEYGLFGR